MGNLLSSSSSRKPVKVSKTDEAVLDLKIARRNLVDTRKKQELLAQRTLDTVKELLKAKRLDAARLALRKQKLHEQQALTVQNHVLRIDEQLISLETAAHQADLFAVLRTANNAVKTIQQQVPLEEVEKLMDDNAEAAQYLENVQLLLGESNMEFDDGELESELEGVQKEIVAEEVASMPNVPENPEDWEKSAQDSEELVEDLPSVPTTRVEPATHEVEGSQEVEPELVPA